MQFEASMFTKLRKQKNFELGNTFTDASNPSPAPLAFNASTSSGDKKLSNTST